MKNRLAKVLIVACFLTAIHSSIAETKFVQTNHVSLSAFSNMRRGISVNEVQQLLKSPGEHQFTALHENLEYLCRYFLFDEPRVSFYLIFTNNHLKAVVDRPKTEFDRVPYKGSFREIPKPVDSENQMQSVLTANDLSKTEIEDRMRNAIPKGKESLNILPAFIILAPLFALKAGEINQDYRRNKQFAEKFDPLKVKLGSSPKDLEAVFGTPFRTKEISPGEWVQIYGSDVPLRINPSARFSWVSAVFENGKVTRVFSHLLFDKRLKEAGKP